MDVSQNEHGTPKQIARFRILGYFFQLFLNFLNQLKKRLNNLNLPTFSSAGIKFRGDLILGTNRREIHENSQN